MKKTDTTKRYQTLAQAAEYFKVSKSLITRKKSQGKLAMRGDLVDVQRSASAFAKNQQTTTASPDPGESFADGQRRKESALANLRELEFAMKAGELVSVTDAEAAWFGLTRAIRDRLLGLPAQLALTIAGMTTPASDPAQIQTLLDQKLRFALAELAGALPKLNGEMKETD